MKPEQIEAMRRLGKRGADFGELWDTYLEAAFFIHGHVCGGMPLGFRAGLAALNTLSSERELNMAKLVFVETGTGHAAGCFADGAQMATGCTFGKALMQRTEYGKWAMTLVDKETHKAVRVSVRPVVMKASFDSPFVKMRKEGMKPTEIPLDVSKGLVENLLQKSDGELFVISDVFDYDLPKAPRPTFELVTCHLCGEVVAANRAHVKSGETVCLPCSGYSS
jgi:formylmethanofuran dehydrogenase subunit E